MALCEKCREGNHHHDRFTSDGADAGCPFLASGGAECGCVVVVHTARSTRNGAHCASCTCGMPTPAPRGRVTPDQYASVAQDLTRKRMAHYGYTPGQIQTIEDWPGHDDSGCFLENWNWVCADQNDKPNHPDVDAMDEAAEFVCWVLDNLPPPPPGRPVERTRGHEEDERE